MKTSHFLSYIILSLVLLFGHTSLYAQEVNDVYIKTKAQIQSIELSRSGRSVKELATIKFTTEAGHDWETIIELERIPFLGSMSSVGDEISIYYNEGNPSIAQTYLGRLLSEYGLYLLILIGAILSIGTYLKALKQSKTANTQA